MAKLVGWCGRGGKLAPSGGDASNQSIASVVQHPMSSALCLSVLVFHLPFLTQSSSSTFQDRDSILNLARPMHPAFFLSPSSVFSPARLLLLTFVFNLLRRSPFFFFFQSCWCFRSFVFSLCFFRGARGILEKRVGQTQSP